MTKRGNNEGSIYPVKTGGYRAALTLPTGKRKYVSGKTRKAVADQLAELQHEMAAGLPVGATDRLDTFAAWWLRMLEAKAEAGQKSPNTVDNARWAVETWIKPALGAKRLRQLEPEDVENLLADMAAAGRSRSSIVRVRSYFGQLLAAAERRGKVARNVARISEMPATKPPTERRALTEKQASALLEASAGHRLEALLLTGLMLGLRPGELTGLRWTDVDLDTGVLRVEQSLKNERGNLRLGPTKTPRSRRTLNLPAPLLEALHVHQLRQELEQKAAGAAWRRTALIFTTEIGTAIDPSNLRCVFGDLTEKAGLGRWTTNEARHSAASILSAAGVPLEVIADILGHGDTRMLQRHYRHSLRPSIDAHVVVMDRLFGADAIR